MSNNPIDLQSNMPLVVWYDVYRGWLRELNLAQVHQDVIYYITVLLGAFLVSLLLYRLAKFLMVSTANLILNRMSERALLKAFYGHKVFSRISFFVPLFVARYIITVFLNAPKFESIIIELFYLSCLFLLSNIVSSLLNTGVDYYQCRERNRSKPIKGLVQFFELLVFTATFIIAISLLFSIPMIKVLGGLGAASAIVILVFKDSVSGLIAGIQLSFNNMLKIGDWISLDKYGINGEVIDINLATVKVKNWDKTISTVPAYNLIASDSVKNWQGVLEFGGRRIARAINIDMNCVQFCTVEMLDRYEQIEELKHFIKGKRTGNDQLNDEQASDGATPPNARPITNLSVFRAYLEVYVQNHDGINHLSVPVVRQLDSGPNGVPIQVHCFTNTTVWKDYERIQSDIFDHVLAVIPFFHLKVFQNPNGSGRHEGVHGADDSSFNPNANVEYSNSSITFADTSTPNDSASQ